MIKYKLTPEKINALEKIVQIIIEYVHDLRTIRPIESNMKRSELGAHLFILEELEFKLNRKLQDLNWKKTPANKPVTYQLNPIQAYVLMHYNNIPPVKTIFYEFSVLQEISIPTFQYLLT